MNIMMLHLSAVLLIPLALSAESPSRLNLLRFFMGFGPEVNKEQKISFNPEAGLRFREQYEKKYGTRGQLLIERLGKGLAPEGPPLVDIDQLLEPSKNKTKHYRTHDFASPKTKTRKDVEIKVNLNPSDDDI
ncbi:uncharacterized protein LOC129005160 [Macrosteles quadrilineatus]|uniref:uncharacterized protein LOC129005160 n=1 Tax=Macrosteles quadrilineatus TaxID=74068 RepID=UPI0023E2D46D|nr:uncharacterized protein LOC129005160 [Macrosteles quadrilineatus]